jgi:hypothetical protein
VPCRVHLGGQREHALKPPPPDFLEVWLAPLLGLRGVPHFAADAHRVAGDGDIDVVGVSTRHRHLDHYIVARDVEIGGRVAALPERLRRNDAALEETI